jgi:hypothetical protein
MLIIDHIIHGNIRIPNNDQNYYFIWLDEYESRRNTEQIGG